MDFLLVVVPWRRGSDSRVCTKRAWGAVSTCKEARFAWVGVAMGVDFVNCTRELGLFDVGAAAEVLVSATWSHREVFVCLLSWRIGDILQKEGLLVLH
jgi:hypothetical protein